LPPLCQIVSKFRLDHKRTSVRRLSYDPCRRLVNILAAVLLAFSFLAFALTLSVCCLTLSAAACSSSNDLLRLSFMRQV
jgi:hypothetical protein